MFAYCNNSPVMLTDPEGEFALLTFLAVAAVGAIVSVASSYVAAKATGQEYTLRDGVVAASVGIVNAIPVVGPYIAGAVSGGYSAYKCLENDGTWGQAAFCFFSSGLTTAASIGNLANLGTSSVANIAATGAADLVFGTGYACISEAANCGICQSSTSQQSSQVSTSSSRCGGGNAPGAGCKWRIMAY